MKIEIKREDPLSNMNDYSFILVDGEKIINHNTKSIKVNRFTSQDIFSLLGSAKYKDFENGKSNFIVVKKYLQFVTGEFKRK